MPGEYSKFNSLQLQLLSLHVGRPQLRGADEYSDKPWKTGFFKKPVQHPLQLSVPSENGVLAALEGDGQADLQFHGGPDKAVCAYAAEHYRFWRGELEDTAILGDAGPFDFGAFGENFTLQGATEDDLCIGDIFTAGEGDNAPVLQISQPRQPCWKLARRWNVKDLAWRVQQNGKTGWYFRVLREGVINPDIKLRLAQRPYPTWTLKRANDIMHHQRTDLQAAAGLAACAALSQSWKRTLQERMAKDDSRSIASRLNGQ